MELERLGPLEQAIVRALLQAEALGVAHPIPAIWCCLPGYRTNLANVQRALIDGSPLRRHLIEAHGHFALRDQGTLLASLPARRRGGDELWNRVESTVRALARLPYVEGVALSGSMAWGMPQDGEHAVDLVVLAEGGRAAHASRAVGLFLRSRPEARRCLRVVELIDSDRLDLSDRGPVGGLALLTLRPVVCQSGFEALWNACPWLLGHFPNYRVGSLAIGGLLDPYLGDRQDGALATLRRRAARAPAADEAALLTTVRRRTGLWTRVEDTLRGRSPLLPGPDCQASLPGLEDALVERRWAEVASWEWPEPVSGVTPDPAPAAAEVPGPSTSTAPPGEQAEPSADHTATEPAVDDIPDTDSSSDEVDSAGAALSRAAASPETGQRAKGSGRKKPRSRSRRPGRRQRGARRAG